MTISSADQAYTEWLITHPDTTICTHWRKAFAEGYEAAVARAERAETRLAKIDVSDKMTPYPADFIKEMTALEDKYNATYETDDTWIEMVSFRHYAKWVDIADNAEKKSRAAESRAVAAESRLEAVRVALGEEWNIKIDGWPNCKFCSECRRPGHQIPSVSCTRGRVFATLQAGGG